VDIFADSLYSPPLPPSVCVREGKFFFKKKCDKYFDTVEVKIVTRHLRRENGRRIDNFTIKNDDFDKKHDPTPIFMHEIQR
jgi:hypothetical protein